MRLFLDANVLFAAAHSPDGRSRALFELATTGRCSLLSSPHAIEEARRNLALKSPSGSREFESMLEHIEVVAEAGPRLVSWAIERGLPLNDAPILAAAVSAGADLLVTGDRTHFGHLYDKTAAGVVIVSPRQALARELRSRRR